MAGEHCRTGTLSSVSYNMHGFYQGAPTIEFLISENNPDIFMLQEHWLTPMNLCLFEKYFGSYFAMVALHWLIVLSQVCCVAGHLVVS